MTATPTFAAIRRLAPVVLGARGGAWLVQGIVAERAHARLRMLLAWRVGALLGLRGECTIVLVSHPPRVLRHADRVLRLGAGAAEPASIVNEEWPASPV